LLASSLTFNPEANIAGSKTEGCTMEDIYRIIQSNIASKPWSAEEIVESFEHKIGLCGDNGYESIYFPENQDKYGIEVEGWVRIEPGMVELTYWGGEEKIIYLSEGD